MAVAWGGGAGGPDSRGGMAGGDGREPDGAGAVRARRARWSTREEMAGYRRARWQLLWVVGRRGMAGSQMGQGKWRHGGPDGWGERGWQGARGPDGSCWGCWGRRGNGKEHDGVGIVGVKRARWLEREGWQGAGGPDGSCWGSGVVGGWQV